MGLVYDKYCYVSGSSRNCLILQKFTKIQRFVCSTHLNFTNIQLSFIGTAEIEYCENTAAITLVTVGYRNVNAVSYVLCSVPIA